ncbi:MAG: thiol-disulfide oxidoreductase DCC family protein [Glycocaulis sp.]
MGHSAPGCTVFFDGACPMCRAEIGYYAAKGSEAAFHDVSASCDTLPEGLTPDTALARFHVRLADGTLVSGARAFAALWQATPGWRWAGRLAATPPLVWLLEGLYRLFLPVRPVLQRVWRAFSR